MILRKPYALLIKYFKIIHVFMAVFMAYIIYKTNAIASFLSEYLDSIATTITNSVTSTLFNSFFLLSIILILIMSFIVLALMYFKEKPIKFYITTIISFIALLVYYSFSHTTIKALEVSLIDVRTLKLLHDFTYMALALEFVIIIFTIIRATGFDIKDFNFKKDLEELNIETKDNEEFEVDVNFDTDKLLRKINKKMRYLKYGYFENKLLINIIVSTVTFIIVLIIYLNVNVYNKVYNVGDSFKTNQFIFDIRESFITKYDYKNNIIKNDSELVIIKLNTRSINKINKINASRFYLEIKGKRYYHNTNYKDKINDLGTTYLEQKIDTNYSSYLLVFEIPTKKEKEKMILKYVDTDKTVKKIKIKSKSLNDNSSEAINSVINEKMSFEQSALKNSNITISNYEIKPLFELNYNYCIKNNCVNSLEYLKSSNNKMLLLKLDGILELEEKNEKIDTLYEFISYYGTIKYEVNGNKKEIIKIKKIDSKKTKNTSLYMEVPVDIANSDKIYIEFNIRNKKYVYNLK